MSFMKRFCLVIFLSAISFAATAREFPKNMISVEAGYNAAWMTSYGVKASAIPAFMVGLADQIRLTEKHPFYFETGLMFQGKGYAINGYEDSRTATYHLQIPLNIKYHIYLNDLVRLEPGAGLYFAAGIGGKLSYAGTDIDVFKNGILSRHDIGWSCSLDCGISRFFLGVAYEMGFLKVDRKDVVYGEESGKLGYRDLRNYVFSVRIGVCF